MLTFFWERDQPRLWPFSANMTAANIAARPTAASKRWIVLGYIECKPHELATTADILHRIFQEPRRRDVVQMRMGMMRSCVCGSATYQMHPARVFSSLLSLKCPVLRNTVFARAALGSWRISRDSCSGWAYPGAMARFRGEKGRMTERVLVPVPTIRPKAQPPTEPFLIESGSPAGLS